MLFMFGMDFRNVNHQHKLIESLLEDTKKETVVIKENINIDKEDISF